MSAAEWLALAVVLGAAASVLFFALRLGIGPVPTSPAVRRVVLAQVPADTRGPIHELGAGWGGLALALAARCPGARVVAFERSPVPRWVLRLRCRLLRRANVEVRGDDFFAVSHREAQLVVCYLFTGAMARLGEKLRAELQPGAQVVSHTFHLRGWTPARVARADDVYRTEVFSYVAPGAAGPATAGTAASGPAPSP